MTQKTSKFKRFLLILSIVIIALFISIITLFIMLYNKYDLNKLELTKTNNGIRVYSSNETNSNLFNTSRAIIEIETLPDYVKNAFIDIEEEMKNMEDFYDNEWWN